MQRRTALIAGAAVLVLILAGFGALRLLGPRSSPKTNLVAAKPSSCTDTYRVLKLAPSEISAADPNCLVQSLQVTGELHGSVGSAYTIVTDTGTPTSMCSMPKRWDNLPTAALALTIGGKAYALFIAPTATSNRQPLNMSAAGTVELQSYSDLSVVWNQATGTVGIDPEGVSGTIDANLSRDIAGAKPVHITGQWACGVVPPLPQVQASLPCGSFFALNQLAADDVARMKAGCNTQDLTFTGNVAGQVTQAVTDTAGPHRWYFGADNVCTSMTSGYFSTYIATIKFAIGYESFLLELADDGSQPGQYPAATNSLGVILFLGNADPSQQGLFAYDNKVWWTGQSGTFTVNSDMKSGTVDADLQAPINGSTVHVSGSWRCAP